MLPMMSIKTMMTNSVIFVKGLVVKNMKFSCFISYWSLMNHQYNSLKTSHIEGF